MAADQGPVPLMFIQSLFRFLFNFKLFDIIGWVDPIDLVKGLIERFRVIEPAFCSDRFDRIPSKPGIGFQFIEDVFHPHIIDIRGKSFSLV